MEQKYDFVEVTLAPEDYDKIREVYRLHKEQSNKVFNLASGIDTNEDIMDCIENDIENNLVLLAIDKSNCNYAGVITLDNMTMYNGVIVSCGVHIIISKKYWGKESRRIINDCYKYAKDNMKPINRIECFVPANNFGIIKLLKDVGFKIEGTLKNRLLFYNKKGVPTYYNELVYSNTNLGD